MDGGSHFSVNPILWTGDGDSGVAPAGIPFFQKETQDESDLRFCLDGIREWPWTALYLYGFLNEGETQTRMDHELANLGELHREFRERKTTQIATFYNSALEKRLLILQAGEHHLNISGRFSLLAFESSQITLQGECQFKATDHRLHGLSGRGISNTASGPIFIRADRPLMLTLNGTP